jgi:hypothetical protein
MGTDILALLWIAGIDQGDLCYGNMKKLETFPFYSSLM